MIIIHYYKKYKYISQNIYSQIVNPSTLHEIFENTEFEGFQVHCYYERYVITPELKEEKINVMRIKCNGTTHTVLLDSMVPYLSYPYSDVHDVVFDHAPPCIFLFSDYVIRYIRKAVAHFLDNFSYASLCMHFIHHHPLFFITPLTPIDFDS